VAAEVRRLGWLPCVLDRQPAEGFPHAVVDLADGRCAEGAVRAAAEAAELAGRVGVTLLVPGGVRTAFLDARADQYRPGPDAMLPDATFTDPADVARAVAFCLRQPPGCEIRELVVTPSREPSWP
jgi:NADP-dependent 3-hydroxy acid dehydrogenase YdfG